MWSDIWFTGRRFRLALSVDLDNQFWRKKCQLLSSHSSLFFQTCHLDPGSSFPSFFNSLKKTRWLTENSLNRLHHSLGPCQRFSTCSILFNPVKTRNENLPKMTAKIVSGTEVSKWVQNFWYLLRPRGLHRISHYFIQGDSATACRRGYSNEGNWPGLFPWSCDCSSGWARRFQCIHSNEN